MNEIKEFDEEVIAQHLIELYTHRLEYPGTSIKRACENLGLPYRSVLGWLKDHKLADYLAEIHDPRSDLSQAVALNNLPGIVQTMADVATGKTEMRGSNPQAAAEFVLKVAQLGANAEPRTVIQNQQAVYIPQLGDEPRMAHHPHLVEQH